LVSHQYVAMSATDTAECISFSKCEVEVFVVRKLENFMIPLLPFSTFYMKCVQKIDLTNNSCYICE